MYMVGSNHDDNAVVSGPMDSEDDRDEIVFSLSPPHLHHQGYLCSLSRDLNDDFVTFRYRVCLAIFLVELQETHIKLDAIIKIRRRTFIKRH